MNGSGETWSYPFVMLIKSAQAINLLLRIECFAIFYFWRREWNPFWFCHFSLRHLRDEVKQDSGDEGGKRSLSFDDDAWAFFLFFPDAEKEREKYMTVFQSRLSLLAFATVLCLPHLFSCAKRRLLKQSFWIFFCFLLKGISLAVFLLLFYLLLHKTIISSVFGEKRVMLIPWQMPGDDVCVTSLFSLSLSFSTLLSSLRFFCKLYLPFAFTSFGEDQV